MGLQCGDLRKFWAFREILLFGSVSYIIPHGSTLSCASTHFLCCPKKLHGLAYEYVERSVDDVL